MAETGNIIGLLNGGFISQQVAIKSIPVTFAFSEGMMLGVCYM